MALSEQEILSGIADILNEQCGVATKVVRREQRLHADYQFTGDDYTTIIDDIRHKFGVIVTSSDLNGLATIGELVAHIQAEQP